LIRPFGHARGSSAGENILDEESDIKGIQMLINPLDDAEEENGMQYPILPQGPPKNTNQSGIVRECCDPG
jgi:hypothetical protein